MITGKQLTEAVEAAGYKMTKDIKRAIYIFPDGQMLDGEYNLDTLKEAPRKLAHGNLDRVMNCMNPSINVNVHIMWDQIHLNFNPVIVVPENRHLTTWDESSLTDIQKEFIDKFKGLGFEFISDKNLDGRYYKKSLIDENNKLLITGKQLKDIVERVGLSMTDLPTRAIYIFPDGQMLDGGYNLDTIKKQPRKFFHGCMDRFFDSIDTYDKPLWGEFLLSLIHDRLSPIIVVPENKVLTTWADITITEEQWRWIAFLQDNFNYKLIIDNELDGRYYIERKKEVSKDDKSRN